VTVDAVGETVVGATKATEVLPMTRLLSVWSVAVNVADSSTASVTVNCALPFDPVTTAVVGLTVAEPVAVRTTPLPPTGLTPPAFNRVTVTVVPPELPVTAVDEVATTVDEEAETVSVPKVIDGFDVRVTPPATAV
jgi:hypothetical protein